MRILNRNDTIERGLASIRDEFDVPKDFPADVLAAADEAAQRVPGAGFVDRTDIGFVTLDPATSTDLDQAFFIERVDNDDLLLRYAIADVGFFVDPGSPLDTEAWRRGVTVYLPGHRAALYPPALSEAAASLLPDGPRPAVVFNVRVAPDGTVALDGVERAVIRSRAKLAYDSVQPADVPPDFDELHRRIAADEARRGAPRNDVPEQQLIEVDGAWQLTLRPLLESERQNAAMSLACNMAVADYLLEHRTGLFRVMDEPPAGSQGMLRNAARSIGLSWPEGQPLDEFMRSLPADDLQAAAFMIAVRRASGRARYEAFSEGVKPWHSAMAATYSHATAPLRRLADRYVCLGALHLWRGEPLPEYVAQGYETLGDVMATADERAAKVDRAAVDLAEAVFLAGRQGETFEAVVIDEDDRGVTIQLTDPPVIARCRARKVDPGDRITVRLVEADPDKRAVTFERLG